MGLTPELARWRKAERQTLIARRMAAPPAEHVRWSAAIESQLRAAFPFGGGWVVGLCWPFQAEFDARPFATHLRSLGARLALPMVIAKGCPLEFREWWPGVLMASGVYDLPVPDGTVALVPDALLVPPVGIGQQGDRLGYGGGFFDRTLAALDPRPLTVAHAFELSRIPTTHPQPHDVLMDFVVTEAGIQAAVPGGLEAVTVEKCRRRAERLAARRGLPRHPSARV
ncbi:MAG TPA: 5-formyltetrahydrofolate cyclo-ligase [Steroidobacteraceae bacterium]|nr:5-formyltetrahydrofolate cyclo-ligase [Steroidobacteraceae bacterium]